MSKVNLKAAEEEEEVTTEETTEEATEEEVEAENAGLKSMVSEIAEELYAKHAEALERRAKNHRINETEKTKAQLEVVENASATVRLFKALSIGDRGEAHKAHLENRRKYLNEGDDEDGGFLVDPEFSREVYRIMQDYSVFRRNATVIQMGSDVFNLKTVATNPSAFWTDEAAAISGTTVEFGAPVLTAKKLASVLPWTNEVMDDQYVGLLQIIQERIAEAMAQAEEVAFTTGASPFTGIINASGTTNVTMASGDSAFSDITWDHLIDMSRALEEVSVSEASTAKYYMSPYVWSLLQRLKTSGDGNYFMYSLNAATNQTAPNGQTVEIVQSYPSLSDSGASEKFVTLTDLRRHGFIGDRGGLRVDIFNSGVVKDSGGTDVNLITQDSKAMRVIKRTAYQTVLPAGVVQLVTGIA